jgi:hypothetical protein
MSFRKYGGTQFASSHNIVKSNVNTTDSFYVTKNVGQPNTYINFESDISGNVNIYGDLDVSGNLIVSGDADINGKLHVQENIDCSGNVNVDGDVTASKMFLTAPNHTYLDNEVVPKSYVNSVAVGLKPLAPCNLCSNAGIITLSGFPIIDGVQTTSGMRILVNAQGGIDISNNDNGIYVVNSGSWTRATDLVIGDEATGTAMLILQGTTYADYRFVCALGSNTSPVFIGTNPVTNAVLWTVFDTPFKLGQGLNKEPVGTNTVINVDSSLNFINFLDNNDGPNAGTINIGTTTTTTPPLTPMTNINIGNAGVTVAINGTTNITGGITASGLITANAGITVNNALITANAGITTTTLTASGVITANTLTASGLITANAGIGTTTLTASGLITANTLTASGLITANTLTASGLITANAGIGTTTLTASGLITANTLTASGLITANTLSASGLITANAGIGTTTLTASGLITANTLTASGLITANNGLTVTGTTNINNSIYLYNGSNNSVIYENGPTLNLINNNAGGNVSISNSAYPNNNISFDFDTNGNTLTFNNNTSDSGFIRWYSTGDPNSYLQIGTTDNANYSQEEIYFTQFQENGLNPGTTYVRMRIDTTGVWINPSGDTYFTAASTYSLNVNGQVNATSYNSASDYRIKKDVVTLDETFTVDKLRPVTYNNTKLDKQDIGLIAHELQEIYPFLVNGEKDGEHFQSVNYTGLIGILIKEIQDLKERVKKLEEK